MKKVFLSLITLVITTLAVNAQTVTGTLVGIGSDSVGVYARPSADVNNFTLLNIVFCISIADQGGSNPTTAELGTALRIYSPNLSLDGTVLNVVEDGRSYYCFNLVGPADGPTTSWTTAGINTIATIKFNNLTTLGTSMRLENLPEGGSNGFMSWYVAMQGSTGEGGDGVLTPSTSTMFFGTTDNPATNNSTGSSFVPLQQPVVLPVKFNHFNALANILDVNLDWEVAGETTSTSHYEIERSYNGKDFSTISRVAKSTVSSLSNKQYSGIDANILSKMASGTLVYYRIKEVTRTGRIFYSDIRNVRMGAQPEFTVNIFPNPAHDVAVLNVNMVKSGMMMIQILDASGKVVSTQSANAAKGGNTKQMDIQNLQPGTYFVKVISGDQVKITRLVIK